jgi:hypothetical protein
MIDVYAAAGTFADEHQLAVDLATAVMTIEQVPDIPMFRKNTAAFVHDLDAGHLAPPPFPRVHSFAYDAPTRGRAQGRYRPVTAGS